MNESVESDAFVIPSRSGIINKIRAYALQDEGADTVEANERLGFVVDAREYQQCVEVLFDLGLCKVKVISNNPDKLAALQRAGLRIGANSDRGPIRTARCALSQDQKGKIRTSDFRLEDRPTAATFATPLPAL